MSQSKSEDKKFTVDMQPIGRRTEISEGKSILEAAQDTGVGLVSLCGGEGWCYRCLVKIISGELNEPTSDELVYLSGEQIENGYRLACQAVPESDVVVDIPPDSLTTPQRLQVEGLEFQIPVDPKVKFADLEISPPSLEDLRSDAERIIAAMSDAGYGGLTMDFPIFSGFSDTLRENKWKGRIVVNGDEIISILPYEKEIFGLAVDIGTTKVAVYLLSLETGEVVGKVGEMNPQIGYGEDVISRIAYTNQNENGRSNLQQILVETLNKKIDELCNNEKILNEQIVDTVIVGNTAMHHLFAGLPVGQLVYAPYVAAVSEGIDFKIGETGLKMGAGTYIHMLPNIAGYVGADHAAVVLATELWKTEKNVIAIDIGTNTEITLAVNGRMLSCSCASGPAFEGAHISHGMRAAPGAIERVQILEDESIHLLTIDGQLPVGICGSGILDVVAEMKANDVINERGSFVSDHPRVKKNSKDQQEYLLVESENTGHGKDIVVTRSDINEIQLAKGAIRAGLEILLKEAGILAEDVDEIIIAGAFGTYIDVGNAVKIGMFPDIPLERFRQVGNAAGMGARLALVSQEQREVIQEVIGKVEYVELTTRTDFQEEFVKAIYLR